MGHTNCRVNNRINKINMVVIEIKNGNMCQLEGPAKTLLRLFNEFRIKHPQAWFIYQRNTKWDGYVNYISESGSFKIGLTPMIYNKLISYGEKVKVIDRRSPLGVSPRKITKLGDKTLRPEQIYTLEAIKNNKLGDTPFQVGVIKASVNFGKTLIMAGMYESYHRKLNTLILLNSSDLFNQFKKEIPELLPGEDVGFIQGRTSKEFHNINVAMVQSLGYNIKYYARFLSQVDMVLIDEADVIDNKTYSKVIQHLYNARIRLGLSGTIYMDGKSVKKNIIHHMNIRSYIGDVIHEVKLREMMDKGYSTETVVKMVPVPMGYMPSSNKFESYQETYNRVVINNPVAYKKSLERTLFNIKYGRLPLIIVCKFIDHCEKLTEFYQKELGDKYVIRGVHHETKKRNSILNDFREGKIDILISTLIISRGQNFPLVKYLQNIASMDSNELSIQILGRLVRTHESKKVSYLDDLVFPGNYLSRHGKHRKNYYLRENLKVIDLGKKKRKKKKNQKEKIKEK